MTVLMQRESPSNAAEKAVLASRIRTKSAIDAIGKGNETLLVRIVYTTSEDYM